MSAPTPPHGIVLLDKPQGWTSHDVVGRCRRLLGTRRVGHAGTLDPMATGLLVVGAGQGTRLLTHLVGLDKTYEATVRLGRATTTDDAEGEPLGEVRDATGLDDERIEGALDTLRGRIAQVPSTVSAIKVDGKRAYARARAGEDVVLAARPVTISRLEVLARHDAAPFVDLDVLVDCSSGTYVRALARDLGSGLGVGGHLTALRRTRIGAFTVEEAVAVPPRGQDEAELPILGLGAAARRALPLVELDEAAATDIGHGKRPYVASARTASGDDPRAPLAALDARERLVAVVTAERDGTIRPVLVIPPDARS